VHARAKLSRFSDHGAGTLLIEKAPTSEPVLTVMVAVGVGVALVSYVTMEIAEGISAPSFVKGWPSVATVT
jgi:hypothetical protein